MRSHKTDNVKILMQNEGLMQKDLAKILGTTAQTISRFFKKEKIPDIWCRVLKETYPEYSFDWICGRDVPMIDDPSKLFREKMKEHLEG